MTLVLEPPAGFDYTTEAPRFMAPEDLNPMAAMQELRALVEHGILHQPRSQQKTIGPSEIGTECDHCLAAKLAGWESTEKDVPWLPFVGTAMHSALEEMVMQYETRRNAVNTTGLRYLTESKVLVGHIDGQPITGSTDLVDFVARMTFDYKLVGVTTLRNAKKGPSQVYRVQQHLYAKGWNDAGYDIRHVGIWYLPRNAISLSQGIQWCEPYDPALATWALERANRFALNIRAMRSISEEALTSWITQLPRHLDSNGTPICRDCERFPDYKPQPRDDEFSDLVRK